MVAWFARNGVAANLLMMILIVGGLTTLFTMKQELFPGFSLDSISVRVAYPGSTPEEVEEGIVVRIEEQMQDLEGIKKITAVADEGIGMVTVEVRRGYDIRKLLNDIKSRVDAIDTFPEQAERPVVEENLIKREVLTVSIAGLADEATLKLLAERVRDDLIAMDGISQVTIGGVRSYELSVEVSEEALRRHGLTFDAVVAAVREGSLDLPAGLVRTDAGEVLLRSRSQAYTGPEFEQIVLLTRDDGSHIRIGDVGRVVDGFTDGDMESRFNGERAVSLVVFEVGEQGPIEISDLVTSYVIHLNDELPEGLAATVWKDSSFYLYDRLMLLIKNAAIGLLLVFIVLTLFLRPSLAMWVSLGIPISFLGAFLVMPLLGQSINLVSLFAFLLVLGIVVDDAIVVGERVFTEFQRSGPGVESSIIGTQAVAVPVTFAVLTTAVAFIPIIFMPGFIGKFFAPIPLIVIPTLLWSLVESKLILPYHLSLCRVGDGRRAQQNMLQRLQRRVADGLEHFVATAYRPTLRWALANRYLTVATFIGLLAITLGLLGGGWVRMLGFPVVPSDYILARIQMPEGTPYAVTEAAVRRMERELDAITAELEAKGIDSPFRYRHSSVGSQPFMGGGPMGQLDIRPAGNLGEVAVELTKSETRRDEESALALADLWRDRIGTIAGAKELVFLANAAGGIGDPLDIQLNSRDFRQLREVAAELREKLAGYEGLFDIRDTYPAGQEEVVLRLKPTAEVLGLRQADLARQVRQAFFGDEAQRVQRGRNDIRVMVRYSDQERHSLAALESMRIRTPDGREVPFEEVAEVHYGEGFAAINRTDRRRVVNVRADADKDSVDLNAIMRDLRETVMPDLLARYPGVSWTVEGEGRELSDAYGSLLQTTILVMFVIYALLAIPFRSYLQPFIVMAVIPFGLIGAVGGHLLLGKDLSILSILGMVALTGVVVNDSLVLVDYINRRRREGVSLVDAVNMAGVARFRAIMLTSLTTFVGLAPVMLETSLQAQFLIPMSISLAFGVLFATFITLLLVPALYIILEDFVRIAQRTLHLTWGRGDR